jgi:hypothetical protein
LTGNKETYYVWEHQTQPGGGRRNVGPGDNISGGSFANKFPDDITGSIDSYRFFTVSTSSVYDPSKQIPVMIQESGRTAGYEHLWNYDLGTGPLYINGSTQLAP